MTARSCISAPRSCSTRSPAVGRRRSAEVREHLEQRLELLPRYRQKLDAPRTGGLAWPSWERDQRFEIDAHVRHATLPSPGDEPEFLDWISDFYSHRLDRGRPLWEMVLLDGLTGGRWALVSKTHHCLVDGVGSVDVADLLLGAKPAPLEPSAPHVPVSGLAWLGWLQHPPEPVGQVAAAGLAAARAGAHALMHPREALERSRAVIDLLVRDEPIAAPPLESERADRRDPTDRDRSRRAPGVKRGPFCTRRQRQRCRAVCRHRRVTRAAARARRGPAAPGTARDGAGEHPSRGRPWRAWQQGLLAFRRAAGGGGRPAAPLRAGARHGAEREGRRAGAGRRRGDRADRARAAGAPRGPRAGDVREAAVQCHDHQHPRLAASRVRVRRADGRCRADRAARGRAHGRRSPPSPTPAGSRSGYTPIAPLCPTSMYSGTASPRPCSSLRRWRTRQRRHVSERPLRIGDSVVARCASAPIPDEQHSPRADHGPSPTPQEEPRPWPPPPPSSRQPRLLRRRIAPRSSTTSTSRSPSSRCRRGALEPGQIRVKVEASGPLPHRHPRRARRLAGQAARRRSSPATRASGSSCELGPGVTEVALGDRVAMPWLGYACGTCDYCVSGRETLCLEQKNMGYSIDGGFGEYADRLRALRRQGARGRRPVRRGAADLRRRDDLQGGQGRGHALVRPRRRLRRRRPRPPGDPVRRDRRRPRRRRRPASTRSSSSRASSARSSRSTPPKEDPVEAIQRLGGADQAIALAVVAAARSSRPTARCAAAARWCSSPCRPTTR